MFCGHFYKIFSILFVYFLNLTEPYNKIKIKNKNKNFNKLIPISCHTQSPLSLNFSCLTHLINNITEQI